MALQNDLMGASIPYNAAAELGYAPLSVTAAGSTQNDAAKAHSKLIEIATATGADGIILDSVGPGTPCWVFNSSGSTALVYVPVGHTLNTTLNGSFSLITHTGCLLVQYKAKFWMSIKTA